MTYVIAEIQPVVAVLPVFVWWAIAIAIVLIGGGAGSYLFGAGFSEAVNGPIGYITSLVVVAAVGFFAWKRSRDSEETTAKLDPEPSDEE